MLRTTEIYIIHSDAPDKTVRAKETDITRDCDMPDVLPAERGKGLQCLSHCLPHTICIAELTPLDVTGTLTAARNIGQGMSGIWMPNPLPNELDIQRSD